MAKNEKKTTPKDYSRWDGRVGITVTKKPNGSKKTVKRGK